MEPGGEVGLRQPARQLVRAKHSILLSLRLQHGPEDLRREGSEVRIVDFLERKPLKPGFLNNPMSSMARFSLISASSSASLLLRRLCTEIVEQHGHPDLVFFARMKKALHTGRIEAERALIMMRIDLTRPKMRKILKVRSKRNIVMGTGEGETQGCTRLAVMTIKSKQHQPSEITGRLRNGQTRRRQRHRSRGRM